MKFGKKKIRQATSWLNVSIVGMQFPIAMLIGFFFGKWLDGLLGTHPWMTAFFSLCGVAAGFVNLFRITVAATRAEELEAKRMAEEAARDEGAGDDT